MQDPQGVQRGLLPYWQLMTKFRWRLLCELITPNLDRSGTSVKAPHWAFSGVERIPFLLMTTVHGML